MNADTACHQTFASRRARWIVPLCLLLICAACFALRTVWLHDRILGGDTFTLQDNDPWYHYRILEYQIRNLPRALTYDPFLIWPGGGGTPVGPFFDLVPAAFIRLVGGADPPQRLIELVAAYYAPILAMGVCIVAFLAMRVVAGPLTALFAALLVGVLPGAHFIRSSLGFFDHHVMEVLLSSLVLYLLLLALRRAEQPDLDPINPPSDEERTVGASRRPRALSVSLLAGLALGCYLLTWIAGNYLLMILLAWLVVQHVCDHLNGRPPHRLTAIMVPCFVVAAAVLMLFPDVASTRKQASTLVGGIVLVALLGALSWLVRRRGLRPMYYPLAVLVAGIAGLFLLHLIAPSLIGGIRVDIARLMPDTKARTITEARPLLYTNAGWSIDPLWKMFFLTFPMAIAGLVMLFVRFIRRSEPGVGLLVVWSVIVLASMFGQTRFAYYAAPIIAMLVACFCRAIVVTAWTVRRSASRGQASPPTWLRKSICAVLVAGLLGLTIVPMTDEIRKLGGLYDGPSEDWREALAWLRENSPEPFGDPDAYYLRSGGADDFAARVDVSGAYGVMSWWDYGYWISGLARRIPNSNPTQAGAVKSARFLLMQDEEEACALLDALTTRYVILDWLLVRWQKPGGQKVTGKFSALPIWMDEDLTQYYERVVTVGEDGRRVIRYFYYPPYFQSMCVRLFVYSGQGATPRVPVKVYTLQWQDIEGHGRYRAVTAIREFETYEQAQAFIDAAGDPSNVIASEDPYTSCVPLEPLRHMRLVHQSPTQVARLHGQSISPVRIFEYLRSGTAPEPSTR